MKKRFLPLIHLLLAGLFLSLVVPVRSVRAEANLSIVPLTWNVVGLDSNNVNTGPNRFPVGARVCNIGDETAGDVSSVFNWETIDPTASKDYIHLRPGSNTSYTGYTLEPAECVDFYYEVEVTRNAGAYLDTRRYYITATAAGLETVSTPRPRELYVERLISQNRNAVTDVRLNNNSIPAGGTMNLIVGNTYDIQLVGKTATNGYEQLESFINFPNTIFQVNSVTSTFSANAGTDPLAATKPYADGCVWVNDPDSPNYRSCVSTGKYGGNVTVNYNVTVIGGAGSTESLNTLIYDFSGASYHYNADFTAGARLVSIAGPSAVKITKTFSPKVISPGEASVLTISLLNPTTEPLSGVNFTDALQGGLRVAAVPNVSYVGCGPGVFSPAPVSGATSLQFSNGSIAPNSVCTIRVSVTADAVADYPNTTGNLFINTSVDTGNTASDTLKVSTSSACLPGQTLVVWTFPTGSSATNPVFTAGTKAANVTTALASTTTATPSIETNVGSPAPSWSGQGFSGGAYFQFQVDASKYSNVMISFDHVQTTQNWNVSAVTVSSSSDGSTFTSNGSSSLTSSPQNSSFNTSAGATYFRISATGAQNNNARFAIDNVTFSGCLVPSPAPTLTKSFSPDPIIKGSTSTLTFTIQNTATGNVAQSGIAFTDILPEGLSITNGSASVCGGVNNLVLNAATRTISMTGGSLTPGSSCTFNVAVTGGLQGIHENITGFLSSNESGVSTSYATDTLTVIAPPVLEKSFSPASIYINQTSELVFTLRNPNAFTSLTGISFSDLLPAGLTAVDGSFNHCNGTLDIGNGNQLDFTGGSLASNGTCTFGVTVTGTTTGTKDNTTTAVTSVQGGSGASASATLVVSNPQPLIGLLKEISTDGLSWVKFAGVLPPQDIYYRLKVSNDGETALTDIVLDDPNVDMGACSPSLPASLAVGEAASCVVGPLQVLSAPAPNPFVNIARADTDTYAPGSEGTSSARYGTKALSLDKSADRSVYSAVNETITYSYLVTNNGGYPLQGPVTVTDDKVSVNCPPLATIGDNDNYLDPGESLTCSSTYTILAGDMTNGSVTNTASASVDGVDSPVDSVTLHAAPNLDLTKSNGSTVVTAGGTITYMLTVANTGGTATSGTITVVDVLPNGMSIGEGMVALTGANAADWGCTAASNVITCSSGAAIPPAVGTSEFGFEVGVSPDASGSLINRAQVGGGGDPLTVTPDADSAGTCSGTNTPVKGCAVDSDLAQAPNLGLTKSNGAGTVAPGGTTTYTLTVSNTGNMDTSGSITVVDVLPNGMSILDSPAIALGGVNAADWGCGASSNVVTCISNAVIVAANGVSVFSFTVNVDADANGILVNKTQVGGGEDPISSIPTATTAGECTADNTPAKGCAIDSDTVSAPSIGLTKSNLSDTVTTGGTTTYTLTVSNTGEAATSGTITVVDVLPDDMTIPNGTVGLAGDHAPDWNCTASDNVITCISVVSIPATTGTSTFSFTVNVDPGATGILTNRAQVGGGGDLLTGTPTAGTVGDCTGANTPVKGCAIDSDLADSSIDLRLVKTASPNPVMVGSRLTYTLSVHNTGPSDAENVTVTDTLPSGVVFVSASGVGWSCSQAGGAVTCLRASLAAGTSPDITILVDVTADAAPSITNNAAVSSTTPEADITNNAASLTTLVSPVADLSLSKSVDDPSPILGNTVVFRLTVTNDGPSGATGIRVMDVLPIGVDYLSDNSSFTGTMYDPGTGLWEAGNLNLGEARSLDITVRVTQTGVITNFSEITGSDQHDPDSTPGNGRQSPSEDDEANVSLGAVFDPPSGIKTFNDAGLPELEFRMVWINSSNTAAIDVQVTDDIPAGTTYVPGSLSCLPRGSSATRIGAPSTPLNTSLSSCAFDPAPNSGRGRIQWQGTIGPDEGNVTEESAMNEVVIIFRVTVDGSVNQVQNIAFSRTDIDGDGDFVEENILGTSLVGSNLVAWVRGAPGTEPVQETELSDQLPATGFAPGLVTVLPEQPQSKMYAGTELWLDIPGLKESLPIVGVPMADGEWDVSWLGNQAGWLHGTAFPSWKGNSVLTGHVTLSNGGPGPFAKLENLKWGDRIIVRMNGYMYIYQVVEKKTALPNDMSVLKHENRVWLTLITCKNYDEATGTYSHRVSIGAVLIHVQPEQDAISTGRAR